MTAAEQTARHMGRTVWRLTVVRAVLWVLIAAGPLVAGAVWMRLDAVGEQLTRVALQAAEVQQVSTAEVEGVAEVALADLLAKSEDPEATSVVRTMSLGVEELDPGYHAVTLAVTTGYAGEAETAVRFYVLGVVSTSAGWAVLGPPAMIAGPRLVEPPRVGSGMRSVDSEAGLTAAVEGFLSAFLVGDGDLARCISPDLTLLAVSPTPFAAVEVNEATAAPVDSGDELVVAVGLEGTTFDGRIEVLEYWLVMEERDGRWEVTDLFPAPPVDLIEGRGEG